jgi:hypothetical protein
MGKRGDDAANEARPELKGAKQMGCNIVPSCYLLL